MITSLQSSSSVKAPPFKGGVGGVLIRPLMLFAISISIGCTVETTARSITIAERGTPMATIVCTSKSEQTRLAVQDLQHYIEKISGARLPIADAPPADGNAILVGRMPEVERAVPDLDDLDLGADGFVMRLRPGRLILTGQSDGFIHPSLGRFRGHTDAGTPNAVYAFLESLGCRWYMPGEDGDYVPRRTTLTISDVDVVNRPDFDSRWIGIWTRSGKPYEDFLRWRARNRISHNTYFHMHAILPALLHDAGAQPDWFALVDGKRTTEGAATVCFSNPQVIDFLSNHMNDIITKQPPFWRSYTVGQADGSSDGWCQCDNCRALYGEQMFTYPNTEMARVVGRAPSDRPVHNAANGYLAMVNEIAKRAEQVNADVLLTYYALYNIPGRPTIRPRDSVLPVICHLAPGNEPWRREALHWASISKHLYYYTYVGYRLDFPRFDIVDDIRWCREHKGIAMYLEHDAFTPVNMVTMYLGARAMWNADVDAGEELVGFYGNFYGAAEAPMRQFFETFDRVTRGPEDGYETAYAYPDALDAALIATCRGYLDEAGRLAQSPVVRRRVDSMSRYWRATELHVAAQDAMARWKADRTVENMKATRRAYEQVVNCINSMENEFSMTGRIALFTHEGYNEDLKEMNEWEKSLKE